MKASRTQHETRTNSPQPSEPPETTPAGALADALTAERPGGIVVLIAEGGKHTGKAHKKENGKWTALPTQGNITWWRANYAPVDELDDIEELLNLAQKYRHVLALRAQLFASSAEALPYVQCSKLRAKMEAEPRIYNYAVERVRAKLPGNITISDGAYPVLDNTGAQHWFMLDIDKVRVPPHLYDLNNPVPAIEWFVENKLPAFLHNHSYAWQLSHSAHLSAAPNVLKAHLFFWSDRPVTGSELEDIFKPEIKKGVVDKSVFHTLHKIFIGAPLIHGTEPDPCPRRVGLVRHIHDVTLPPTTAHKTTVHICSNNGYRTISNPPGERWLPYTTTYGTQDRLDECAKFLGYPPTNPIGEGFHRPITSIPIAWASMGGNNSEQSVKDCVAFITSAATEAIKASNLSPGERAEKLSYLEPKRLESDVRSGFERAKHWHEIALFDVNGTAAGKPQPTIKANDNAEALTMAQDVSATVTRAWIRETMRYAIACEKVRRSIAAKKKIEPDYGDDSNPVEEVWPSPPRHLLHISKGVGKTHAIVAVLVEEITKAKAKISAINTLGKRYPRLWEVWQELLLPYSAVSRAVISEPAHDQTGEVSERFERFAREIQKDVTEAGLTCIVLRGRTAETLSAPANVCVHTTTSLKRRPTPACRRGMPAAYGTTGVRCTQTLAATALINGNSWGRRPM